MAEYKMRYEEAYRHRNSAWLTTIIDPYKVSYYNSDNYWNLLGKRSTGSYEEMWIKISFPEIKLNSIKQIDKIECKVRFELYLPNVESYKSNAQKLILYVYSKKLDKTRSIQEFKKDAKNKTNGYITESAVTNHLFQRKYLDFKDFTFTINNPTSNTYYLVLKLEEEESLQGWTPRAWTGKDALGGSESSASRKWTYSYSQKGDKTIGYRKSENDTTNVKTESIKFDNTKNGYITQSKPKDTFSKEYNNFKHWVAVSNDNKKTTIKEKTSFDATNVKYLYADWEQQTAELTITNELENCSIKEITPVGTEIKKTPKGKYTYNKAKSPKIKISIAPNNGFMIKYSSKTYDLNNQNCEITLNNTDFGVEKINEYIVYFYDNNIDKNILGKQEWSTNGGNITFTFSLSNTQEFSYYDHDGNELVCKEGKAALLNSVNISKTVSAQELKEKAAKLSTSNIINIYCNNDGLPGIFKLQAYKAQDKYKVVDGKSTPSDFGVNNKIFFINKGCVIQNRDFTSEEKYKFYWPITKLDARKFVIMDGSEKGIEGNFYPENKQIIMDTNPDGKFYSFSKNSPYFAQLELNFSKNEDGGFVADYQVLNGPMTIYKINSNGKTFWYQNNKNLYHYDIKNQKWKE